MRIAIGSDHAGLDLKNQIADHLKIQGFEVIDHGTFSNESVDYPDYAHAVSKAVVSKNAHFGILVCGSGIGVSIAANRHSGVRAALVTNTELSALSRQHNNANILCLGGRFTANHHAKMIVDTFLQTEFDGGKHQIRIEKIEK